MYETYALTFTRTKGKYMYKKCKSCVTWKPFEDFYKCKKAADKHQTHCKVCKAEKAKATRKMPAELSFKCCSKCGETKDICQFRKAKNTSDGYRPECKECKYRIDKEYRATNPSIKKNGNKLYNKRHKHKVLYRTRKRQAALQNASPSWVTDEELKQIQKLYETARYLTETTGVPHEVDHIIPIKCADPFKRKDTPFLSGLHVLSNLRVVTMHANRSKCNRITLEELHAIENT